MYFSIHCSPLLPNHFSLLAPENLEKKSSQPQRFSTASPFPCPLTPRLSFWTLFSDFRQLEDEEWNRCCFFFMFIFFFLLFPLTSSLPSASKAKNVCLNFSPGHVFVYRRLPSKIGLESQVGPCCRLRLAPCVSILGRGGSQLYKKRKEKGRKEKKNRA